MPRLSTCGLALVTLIGGAWGVACSSTAGSSSGSSGGVDGGPGSSGSSGASGTSGTSGTSGAVAGALPASTFLYVTRATSARRDVLMAYDVESGQARTVTDLTGDGSDGWSIDGYGLSLDRTRIAISTLYGPTKADNDTKLATQRIWSLATDGTDFRRLTPVFPNTGGGKSGFAIEVRDPAFSKDGADVFYSYGEYHYEGTSLKGGSGLWSVKAAGGALPSYVQLPVSCSIVDPTVDPKTGKLVVIHSVCAGSQSGIYMYNADGSGPPDKLVGSDYATVDVSLETPRWVTDGSGFVFIGGTPVTINGSSNPVQSLFAFDMETRKATAIVVPDQPDTGVRNAAIAPDARAIVYCLRQGEATNLHIIDLTKNPPTDSPLTEDGKSCDPVW